MTILIGTDTIINTHLVARMEKNLNYIKIHFGNDRNNFTTVAFKTKEECNKEWERLCELLNERAL